MAHKALIITFLFAISGGHIHAEKNPEDPRVVAFFLITAKPIVTDHCDSITLVNPGESRVPADARRGLHWRTGQP